MKCPKCGYNSFEFLDACKKCGAEFVAFKKSMGIKPVVFASSENNTDTQQQSAEIAMASDSQIDKDETFSWDLPMPGDKPQGDKPFDGFDLDFIKTDSEPAAADFTFEEAAAATVPVESNVVTAEAFEGFSFDETEELPQEPEDSQPYAQFEQEFMGAEDMEVSAVPESNFFGETGVKGELTVEELITSDRESLENDAPEQSEQIFELDEFFNEDEVKLDKKEEPAKNIATDGLDFDKEFEAIFNDDSSNTKTNQ